MSHTLLTHIELNKILFKFKINNMIYKLQNTITCIRNGAQINNVSALPPCAIIACFSLM